MTLEDYVILALKKVYQNDGYLINNEPYFHNRNDRHNHVGERPIVFRFAHYLQTELSEDRNYQQYNLDCEYNRNQIDRKILPDFPNGVFPDVILHKRGDNDYNLLVIEFKGYWNRNQDDDRKKVSLLTDISGAYGYKAGYTILIDKDAFVMEKYVNGEKVDVRIVQNT